MRSFLCCSVALSLAVSASAQTQTINFEPGEGYATGDIVGQQGWAVKVGASTGQCTVDNTVFSPMNASTQALKMANPGAIRIGKAVTAVNSGVWRVGYDFRYTGRIGSASNLLMSTILQDTVDNQQMFQPFAQDGGGAGAAQNGFTDADGLGGTGFVAQNLIPSFTILGGQWWRLEYTLDFTNHLILDITIYDISSGTKVQAANRAGTFYFNNNGTTTWFSTFDELRVRFDGTTDAGEAWWVDNFSVAPSTLPKPVIVSVPTPQVAFVGSPYTQQLSTTAPNLPVSSWNVTNIVGATVNASGLVSGWTPTAGQLNQIFNFSATATNSGGTSDPVAWQVKVKSPPVADSGLDTPWATIHRDLGGSQSSADPRLTLSRKWADGAMVDWTLDVSGANALAKRANDRSSITFDNAGNLYWKSQGGTDCYLCSATPTGTLRWISNTFGTPFSLGNNDTSSPVVGDGDRVYVLTSTGAAAFGKADGDLAWSTTLANLNFSSSTNRLTPVLYSGKLYVVGVGATSRYVYQLNSTTGSVDWNSNVSGFVNMNVGGQMTLIPNALGAGIHGLYMNGDAGSGSDNGMYSVALNTNTNSASMGWAAPGGKVARSHVVYVPGANRVCTHTWQDYGASMYCWNVDGTQAASTLNQGNSGHGFEDLGAVDPIDNNDVLAGAFDGRIWRYGNITNPPPPPPDPTEVVYDSGGFEALAAGSIVGQDSWVDDTNFGAWGTVQVANDPTATGHGKVMVLDPNSVDPAPGSNWLGCARSFGPTTKQVVTIEFDEFRAANDQNFWVADSITYNGWWSLAWDSVLGKLSAGPTFGGPAASFNTGVWEHVKYKFNFGDNTVTITIGSSSATGGIGDADNNAIDGIDFEHDPTHVVGAAYVDNLVVKQGDAPAVTPAFVDTWYQMDPDFFENRGIGAVYKNEDGKSIYIDGTSTNVLDAMIVGFNVTDSTAYTGNPPQAAEPRLFEYDTGGLFHPQGGPILGPAVTGVNQHIYFFNSDTQLVALTFTRFAAGDYNHDGKVDNNDLVLFKACATRDRVPQTNPNCDGLGQAAPREDVDHDGDVDMNDYAAYQRCFNAALPANPDCYP